MAVITEYWTVSERNSLLPALEGTLLYNRLIAIGISLLALAFAFRKTSASSYRFRSGRSRCRQERLRRNPIHKLFRHHPGRDAIRNRPGLDKLVQRQLRVQKRNWDNIQNR